MIELDIYRDEPTGLPQETSGATVVEGDLDTALDHFFEAKNAAMGPLLNIPGLAMLYAENATIDCKYPDPHDKSVMLHRKVEGLAEIQRFFEEQAEMIRYIVHIEKERSVSGRTAVWKGKMAGIDGPTREAIRYDATFELEFDEDDHVLRHCSRITVEERS
ncbi:hypothetical protein [Aliiruegeria lutimaris]|uniref:SnoaL-like domain-containing protein n=1 Tax=Aliiruegeria lutimaris TaxID=571298 RepID=A0A1G9IB38_9RHOB|nr:hypothetical protein [Aliiruegeria lutimaris]SDL22326.1 hypothetical protein SAMN04488026_107321 [Aliiruegeria lutimaris]